jgi:hypothetical protein
MTACRLPTRDLYTKFSHSNCDTTYARKYTLSLDTGIKRKTFSESCQICRFLLLLLPHSEMVAYTYYTVLLLFHAN